ncbi:MAG: PEP-CTERM sorting domain-containing protein [Planctomycetia bacterium]|nr:PEP-CTERM sorting domain-containing protein [Planctomycetia bacterium]
MVHFSHTFGFPTSGPVFNLPDGFTANSPEGQIANNNFVPEPSTLALAAIGLGLVACYRRRTARP